MENDVRSKKLAHYHQLDALEAMYPVHSSEETLGHGAVLSANKHAAIVSAMSNVGEEAVGYHLYSVLEKSFRQSAEGDLDEARQRIAAITTHNEQYLDRYMNVEAPSAHIGTMIKLAEKDAGRRLTWKEWLVDHATPDELLSFLQYHNYIIEQQQTHPDAKALLIDQKRAFLRVVDRFQQDGILVRNNDVNIDAVDLKVGDIFNMIMKERVGFYQLGVNEICVQQGYLMGPHGRVKEFLENMAFVSTHELVHVVIGKSFHQSDAQLGLRWINEALTEELAHSIDKKNGLEANDTAYISERRLLNHLLKKSDVELGYKLAYRAFSGTASDRQEFIAFLDVTWGASDVLKQINDAVSLREQEYVDAEGEVCRAGKEKAIVSVLHQLKNDPTTFFTY